MGSTAYCAPEQIKGDEVDARTDVYSLGCVLFECLTGEPPFPRPSEAATLYAHLKETPTKPSARRAGVSPELDVVVQKAMAKRPDWRYPSAGDLASAARIAIGQPAERAVRRRSRRPLLFGIAGAVAVLVLGLALALSLGGEMETPPADGGGASLSLRRGLLAVDPATGEISKSVPGTAGVQNFDLAPTLVAGEGALWTTDPSGPIRVDPSDGEVHGLFTQCIGARIDVVLGSVWVACPGGELHRVDPFTFESKEISLRAAPGEGGFVTGIGDQEGWLWVCLQDSGSLYRVDAVSERVEGRVEGVTADLCADGEGSLWVVDRIRSIVTPVDLETGRPKQPITVPGNVDQIAAGAGGVWMLDGDAGTVTRVDPETRAVAASIGIGSGASSITTAFGSVWVTLPADRDLVRIDPLTGDVQRIGIDAAGIYSAPDPQTGLLWIVVEPPADVGSGFG